MSCQNYLVSADDFEFVKLFGKVSSRKGSEHIADYEHDVDKTVTVALYGVTDERNSRQITTNTIR